MKVAKITPRITSHRRQGIKEFLQHEAVLLHKAPHEDHPQHFSGEAASLGVTRFGGSVSSDLRRIYDNPQEKFRRTGWLCRHGNGTVAAAWGFQHQPNHLHCVWHGQNLSLCRSEYLSCSAQSHLPAIQQTECRVEVLTTETKTWLSRQYPFHILFRHTYSSSMLKWHKKWFRFIS